MSVARVVVAVGLVGCCSCSFDTAVPPDASIACAGNAECPPGWVCQGTVGQCVPSTQLDGEPPSVVASSVVVQIRPLVGNRLARPQALGALGEAQVSFTVSEPLSRPPVLSTTCGLECTRARDDFTSFAFSCLTTAQVSEGDCALSVKLVDLALNEADAPLATLRVDVTAPPAPPTGDADKVVYHRRPHGAVATAGVPEWHVSISAALADAVALVARSGAFERALAGLDGGAPGDVPLLELDSPSLEVAAIDAAGNQSAWARVRDGRWVASPGASGTSPHRLELVGAFGPLARPDVVTRGPADGLANVDGVGAAFGGAGSWSMANLGPPIASRGGAIAVDLGRSRLVRWGGDTPGLFSFIFGGVEPVCEWRGEGWQCAIGEDPESDGNPEPRTRPALVYDETRRQIVLHGGRNSIAELLSDTWAWNGHSWKRIAKGPAVSSAAAFWDTPRRRLVLVGGAVDAGVTDESWAWDGTSWSKLPDNGPTPRLGAALAFDRRTGTAWLFGGKTATGVLGDTWRYDGTGWSAVDAGAGPEARVNGHFAWDFDRGEGLLWGGQSADGGWRQDAWWWDGAHWSQRGDGGLPSYRYGGDTLAYEPWARRFVSSTMLAQGPWLTDITSESWLVKDGVASLVPTPTSSPPSALRPALTCRGPLGCVVLNEAGRLVKFGEAGFEPLFGPDAGLPAVTGVSHRLAWDSSRQRYVATVVADDGGTGTWELSQGAGVWSWQNRAAPSPEGMYFLADTGAEVVCPSAERLTRTADSWGWTGSTWRPLGPIPPLASPTLWSSLTGTERSGGGLWALLSTVLPFGQVLYEVVDGGTWLPADGGEPAPTAAGMLAEDPVRGRLVAAHGLVRSSTPSASTFERLGPGQWVQLPESDPEGDGRPPGRVGGAMGWEPRTQSLLVFGGSPEIDLADTGVTMSDAWRLQVSPHRPASVFRASLDELQLEPGAELVSLEVRATAGGAGEADGGALNGVRLATWADGRWDEPGVEHGQGVGQPAPLTLRIADPQRLEHLVTGQPDLNAALVTRGANGTDFARLFVDAVELEVAYRLPP